MTLYNAAKLFYLKQVPPDYCMPTWANLKAVRHLHCEGESPEFAGPGLYALFLNKSLFYIGLNAGQKRNPLGGSVLNRWGKHIVGQTLRSRYLCFKPGPFI